MQADKNVDGEVTRHSLDKQILAAVSVLFLVALAIAAARFLRIETFADDVAYIAQSKNAGAWDSSTRSYQGWSGRFATNYLLFSAIVSPWAWKSIIVASLLLLGASVARLSVGSALPWVSGSALALATLVCLTDRRVQFESMWWVTGSFNYLLPVALGLFAVSVLLRAHGAGPLQRALGLMAAAIAAYHEQMAVSLVLTAGVVLAWAGWHRSRNRDTSGQASNGSLFAKLFGLVVVINTAIQLLAPGNKARLAKETETWFPAFAQLSVPHKLMLGIERLVAHLVTPDTRVFHALCLVTAIVVWQRRRAWGGAAWCALVVLFSHALFTLLREPRFGSHSPYPASTVPSLATGLDISWFANLWVLLAMAVMMAVRLAMATTLRERGLAALPWLVAAGSVVMVGLSPTIYASSWRILYVADVVLVIALLDLLRKAGWLAGRMGLSITGVAIAAATWRVAAHGSSFFLR